MAVLMTAFATVPPAAPTQPVSINNPVIIPKALSRMVEVYSLTRGFPTSAPVNAKPVRMLKVPQVPGASAFRKVYPLRDMRSAIVNCLFLCATSVFAAPRVGPEVAAKDGAEREPLAFFNYGTNVTATSQGYALTWQDVRSGNSSLYGALVSFDGGVLVPGVRLLADESEIHEIEGAVGCRFGNEVLFAVTSGTSNSYLLRTNAALERVRLDAYPYRMSTGRAALACEGPRPLWLLPTLFFQTPLGVVVAHFALSAYEVDGDGGLLKVDGGQPLVADLGSGDPAHSGPATAWDGTRTLVAWSMDSTDGGADGRDVYGAFVTSGAGASSPFPLAGGAGDQSDPRLSWDGVQYTLLWSDGQAPQRDLFTRAVARDGAPGFAAVLANTSNDEREPTLHFDGVATVATWLEAQPSTVVVRLNTAVLPLAGTPMMLREEYLDEVHVATGGMGASFVQVRDFSRGIRAVGSLLQRGRARDAGVIDPSTTLRAQLTPQFAIGGSGPALLWRENRQTVGTRLTNDAGLGSFADSARISSDGRLTVAPGSSTLEVAVLGADLERLDGSVSIPTPLSSVASAPIVTDGGWAFASREPRPDGTIDLVLHELEPGGALTARVLVNEAQAGLPRLAHAADGTTLVVWDVNYRVRAVCVKGTTISPVIDLGSASYLPAPAVASDGENFLVVAVDDRSTAYEQYVKGIRLDPQCQPGATLDLGPTFFADDSVPALTFDGLQYVIVFASRPDPRGDIALVRVSRAGVATAPLLVSADPTTDESQPVVGAQSPGHWWVAYARFLGAEASSARRVFWRQVTDDGLGTRCSAASECASGVCSAGVCCDRACADAQDACEACGVDGLCALRPTGTVCRPSGASCDVEERCNGASGVCPPDTALASCSLCDQPAKSFQLSCDARFELPVDARPTVSGAATWGLRSCDGAALPDGLTLDSATGAVQWTPSPSSAGSTQLLLVAQGATASDSRHLQLDVSCPAAAGTPRRLTVSCGCDAGGGLGFALLGLGALLRRSRGAVTVHASTPSR